jgi:hypothetical protein
MLYNETSQTPKFIKFNMYRVWRELSSEVRTLTRWITMRILSNFIFRHAHDLYSNPQSVKTIPTVVVDGLYFGSLWYSFTIPKQFDIYNHHESVRVLIVSCVTSYQRAVCTDRDFILIQMLHCTSSLQRCKVPVACTSVTLCLWLADRTGSRVS